MLVNGARWPRRRGSGRFLPHTGYPRGLTPWMAQNEWTRRYTRQFAARTQRRKLFDAMCGTFYVLCGLVAIEIAWLYLARM